MPPTTSRRSRDRYCSSVGGQFTQTDPIGIAGGLNTYGYAGGDAINFSDPFGLCPDEDDPDCEKAGGTASVAVSLSAARLVLGANIEVGVAQNSSGDFMLFAKGGQSFGYGQSAAVEVGANTGSFNDLVATGMSVEVEGQLGSHGIAVTLSNPGEGLHYQEGVGAGLLANITNWSDGVVGKNPIAAAVRTLSGMSQPACQKGPTPTC